MLTTTQAAARLGIAAITARKWAEAGRFPGALPPDSGAGRTQWLIPETDVAHVERPERGRPRKTPKPKHPDIRKRAPNLPKGTYKFRDTSGP